ncbi:hypothetical protein B1R32_10682 [Abditibacterium utsteinense]|uniref:Uncharacterized protein n=1 Tax=Abditibacterium utsteinense TaxID=1960156 RepID=A0A2S8STY0_9BACT|nr:hypothetical protein B1R32_10682 [Abditibacterium utsteinense]
MGFPDLTLVYPLFFPVVLVMVCRDVVAKAPRVTYFRRMPPSYGF